MTRHLIIGGGPAAINAVETIREFDGGTSSITLVCDEPAYSRMGLPYWLADQIPKQQIPTGDDDYFKRLKVDFITGRVAKVDPQAKRACRRAWVRRYSRLRMPLADGDSLTIFPPVAGGAV